GGTGSTNEARPGENVSDAPHSRVNENGPGPGSHAACELPSATSGSGRPAALASTSVAPEIRLTRLTPARRTCPDRLNVPRAVSRSTRTFRSAPESSAGTGTAVPPAAGRLARSSSRLYSVNVIVTVRGVSAGRSG